MERLLPTLSKTLLLPAAIAVFALTGCANRRYYAVGPPPVQAGPPPLVQIADSNGYHDGQSDGARDLYQRQQYRPTWDRRYARTPGYDSHLGPYPVYRDRYRTAYLRGYDIGFHRAERSQ